jgi:SAM-dependent methyltransferase
VGRDEARDPFDGLTSLAEIVGWLESRLCTETSATLAVLDPDHARGRYPGEVVEIEGRQHVHRPLRAWLDLAERLRLRLCTPRPIEGTVLIELTFCRLDEARRPWSREAAPRERYGSESTFQRISKLDDPRFVLDLRDALARVGLGPCARVLDLGINAGREIDVLRAAGLPADAHVVGIDHSASVLTEARARWGHAGYEFIEADIGALERLELGRFDLVVSIDTLQSPSIDDRAVLRSLVQRHLAPDGGIVLGFPNCAYLDGEPLYGARMRNFAQPELSLLIKDLAFYRKYLQQHRRRVFITGKDHLLLTGAPIRRQ